MLQVELPEIQPEFANLLNLLEQQDTEALLITKNGKPLARLMRPIQDCASPDAKTICQKRIGVAEGKFTVPDDFDKWDAEVAELFEGYL